MRRWEDEELEAGRPRRRRRRVEARADPDTARVVEQRSLEHEELALIEGVLLVTRVAAEGPGARDWVVAQRPEPIEGEFWLDRLTRDSCSGRVEAEWHVLVPYVRQVGGALGNLNPQLVADADELEQAAQSPFGTEQPFEAADPWLGDAEDEQRGWNEAA